MHKWSIKYRVLLSEKSSIQSCSKSLIVSCGDLFICSPQIYIYSHGLPSSLRSFSPCLRFLWAQFKVIPPADKISLTLILPLLKFQLFFFCLPICTLLFIRGRATLEDLAMSLQADILLGQQRVHITKTKSDSTVHITFKNIIQQYLVFSNKSYVCAPVCRWTDN